MELKLDLHIHSQRSPDGIMTLDEIVSLAKARGLDGAAVCDHDLALTQAPEYDGFLLIPGVEVSTQLGHLLGLFVAGPVDTRDFLQCWPTPSSTPGTGPGWPPPSPCWTG